MKLIPLILSFTQYRSSSFNFILQTFCSPQISHDNHQIKQEFEGEYLAIFVLIILSFITQFLSYIMEWANLLQTMLIFLVLSFYLLLMKNKKIKILKILLTIFSASFASYSFLTSDNDQLIATPIISAMLPVINLIITRSVISSILLFFGNSCLVLCARLIILEKLQNYSVLQLEKMLNYMIFSSYSIGIILFCIIWYYLESRKTLIIDLINQQKFQVDLNKKLQTSNTNLEEAINSKHNLLLNVSHEVRNPLNVIGGSIDLALMCSPNNEVKDYLENIKGSVELLTYLMNHFLDTAKMEKQVLEIITSSIESRILIQRIWRTTKIMLIRKKLYGEIFISKNMPDIIDIDMVRVMQIIYNLVGNAVKFTPNGFVGIVCTWIENSTNITHELTEPTKEEFFRFYFEDRAKEYRRNMARTSYIPPSIAIIQEKKINAFFGKKIQIQGTKKFLQSENTIVDEPIPISTTKFFLYNTPKPKKMISYPEFFSKYHKIDFNTILENENVMTATRSREGFLKIEVLDSGCGIDPADYSSLCKKFSQVGSESNRRLGTGLGLWIIKNLCMKMDGDLVFSSVVNKGSVFIATVKCYENGQ